MNTRTMTTKCGITVTLLVGTWITGCGSDSFNTATTAAPTPVDASAASVSGTSASATDTTATVPPESTTVSTPATESPPEPVEKGKDLSADPFGNDRGNAGPPSLCDSTAPELGLAKATNNDIPNALIATYSNSKGQTFTITVTSDDAAARQEFLAVPMCLEAVPAKGLSGGNSGSVNRSDVEKELEAQAGAALQPDNTVPAEALTSEIAGFLAAIEDPTTALGPGNRRVTVDPVCTDGICGGDVNVGDQATVYLVLDPTVAAGKYDTYSVKTTTYVSALVQSGRGTIFAAIRNSANWVAQSSGAASTGNYTSQMQVWQSPPGGHFLSVHAYASNPWVAVYYVWGTWQIESYGK